MLIWKPFGPDGWQNFKPNRWASVSSADTKSQTLTMVCCWWCTGSGWWSGCSKDAGSCCKVCQKNRVLVCLVRGRWKNIAPTATFFFCGCWCNFFHRPLVWLCVVVSVCSRLITVVRMHCRQMEMKNSMLSQILGQDARARCTYWQCVHACVLLTVMLQLTYTHQHQHHVLLLSWQWPRQHQHCHDLKLVLVGLWQCYFCYIIIDNAAQRITHYWSISVHYKSSSVCTVKPQRNRRWNSFATLSLTVKPEYFVRTNFSYAGDLRPFVRMKILVQLLFTVGSLTCFELQVRVLFSYGSCCVRSIWK